MRTSIWRRSSSVLLSGLVVATLATIGPEASAAAVTVDLCAVQGSVDLPGSPGVPTWGFATQPPAGCSAATASLPGPLIDVNEGDTVTLNVTNALPGTRDLTLDIPGISPNYTGPAAAGPGGTLTATFTASAPGTYLYQGSGDAGRQAAMGLYGPLVVRSQTGGQAYDNGAGSAYDTEAILVLSELDPAFNAAPDAADLNDYLATYWMINGKSYPDTDPITVAPGQRLLIRYLNAGYDQTTMTLLGTHQHVVARDARTVPTAFDASAETIPAGGTEDVIVTMPATAPPSAHGFPLYNRQLHLVNGTSTTPTPTPGGMMTFIHQ